MSKLCENIAALVQYGLERGLIDQSEKIYATNLLMDIYKEEEYEECSQNLKILPPLELILKNLLDIAVERELIPDSIVYRDLFDTRLMNAITPRPSEVNRMFFERYEISPEEATQFYYRFSQDTDYIRRYRLCKDMRWTVDSAYGEMDLSINLSKPEKDPKAIAAAGRAKQSGYPKCQLCVENVGYAGRVNHPARQTHRVIPIIINGGEWSFQYSPYGYYNEHCIVLNNEHVPMKIERATFVKLFDFVKQFPHYFLGSNADLPIVGGSILSHDHYQGGRYDFAMAKAGFEEMFTVPGYEEVTAGIVKWPMSVIRLQGADTGRMIDLAEHILHCWKVYTDEDAFVFAKTEDTPHNTITPIARMRDGKYELDLVLRNNITTPEHPMGVFHPHEKLHHIKKENIGLIEVMGLAVLPARLNTELADLAQAILHKENIRSIENIAKHAEWVEEFLPGYEEITKENVMEILKQETGKVFVKVLEDAGVYKCTPDGRTAFRRFIRTL